MSDDEDVATKVKAAAAAAMRAGGASKCAKP